MNLMAANAVQKERTAQQDVSEVMLQEDESTVDNAENENATASDHAANDVSTGTSDTNSVLDRQVFIPLINR